MGGFGRHLLGRQRTAGAQRPVTAYEYISERQTRALIVLLDLICANYVYVVRLLRSCKHLPYGEH